MPELPPRDPLPRWLAPVPKAVEDLGLRLVWLVVAINIVGTAFGFWFYAVETGQLPETPQLLWPWVPDSPLATLFAAGAFAAWAIGRPQEWLTALAFFGNIILGLWTPAVLVFFYGEYGHSFVMWNTLFWTHLAMVVQAFVLHRIASFTIKGVAVAFVWYTLDLIVDYHVPVRGDTPHHTLIPVPRNEPMWGGATALDAIAATAAVLTLLATFLALATRVAKLRAARGKQESATTPEKS